MAKIMLVEDDNNLREIYEARLLAEGYEIVAAKDGEEALALAVKEKPDLIISDVMMPKISGFDMLDILRSTAETKNTKVIMMTALSQAEDKTRADKLGADRYLVKSQVTLEDVAKVARDVLAGEDSTRGAAPAAPAGEPAMTTTTEPTAVVTPSMPEPTVPTASTTPDPVPAPVTSPDPTPAPEPTVPPATPSPLSTPQEEPPSVASPEPTQEPSNPLQATEPTSETPVSESATTTPEPTESVDVSGGIKNDLTQTTADEEQAVEDQINEIFAAPAAPETSDSSVTPAPDLSGFETQPAPGNEPSGPATESLPVEQPTETVEVAAAPPEEVTPETSSPAPTVVEPTVVQAPESAPQESSAPQTNTTTESVTINNKKVISPISDMSKGPSINDLLQKETENAAVPPPPATSVVSPGGQTIIPVTTDAPTENDSVEPKQPGNVISPGDIAL
jgi:CheY-like chemotaxis protein